MIENRIEVSPNDFDEWNISNSNETYKTRREAIEAALNIRETESIVLFRKNGSVYGELYHQINDEEQTYQEINIEPADKDTEVTI